MVDGIQSIDIYNLCRKLKKRFQIPKKYIIESIVFYPCTKHMEEKYHFYILASTNDCHSYILEFVVNICDFKFDICSCNYLICNRDSEKNR